MRESELQRCAAELLALLDGVQVSRTAVQTPLPTEQKIPRTFPWTEEETSLPGATGSGAERDGGLPEQMQRFPAAEDGRGGTARQRREPVPFPWERGADAGEEMEKIDAFFRRDSRRYDGGFGGEG